MASVAEMISFISQKDLIEREYLKSDIGPNFITGEVDNDPYETIVTTSESLQQSDLLRPFYMTLARKGLNVAYRLSNKKAGNSGSSSDTKPVHRRKVVIVGAGMAGLVAAYELLRAGHDVEILEMTQRFGGRVKTFDEKDGFDRGLHSDAGAMRLPGAPGASHDIHYLTDFYIQKFGLEGKVVPFNNFDKNALLKFYNSDPITIEEWEADSQKNFDALWLGWDKTIKKNKLDIKSIGEYYAKTVDVVVQLLRKRLKVTNPKDHSKQWDIWIKNWGQFALDGFLRSNLEALVSLIKFDDKIIFESDLKPLEDLLPWPQAAITAFIVYNYTGNLDSSLVTFLRGKMGEWGGHVMHSIKGGLSEIPKAMMRNETFGCVGSHVTYNRTVSEVIYHEGKKMGVEVRGVFTNSGESFSVKGDAVILTLPLNILRQISIKGRHTTDKPFPMEFQKAIENVSYSPSTKIMLQYGKRFWQTKKQPIKGGFSRTNLPIGQVHYPTDYEGADDNNKGILLIYTWKSEALLFGSLPEHVAVREAVNQIDRTLHPGSKAHFETGRVQAWYNDPAAQGAYAHLKPSEFFSVKILMTKPWANVYFGGEAISFASGWIQGALESGLRSAYQFYAHNEERGDN